MSDLNLGWKLGYCDISTEITEFENAEKTICNWMNIDLPCDVHKPLLDNLLISDPLVGKNEESSKWIEEKSWWFIKEFEMTNLEEFSNIFINFDMVDCYTDFVLNGKLIGNHISVHFPFRTEVKKYLQNGNNKLIVRVTCGTEKVCLDEIECLKKSIREDMHADIRRVLLRKPQYVYGWDFTTRITTCGITGSVYFDFIKDIAIKSVYVRTLKANKKSADLVATIEIYNYNQISTVESDIFIEINNDKQKCILKLEKDILLKSGINFIDFEFEIENPKLWWPNGAGKQNLYKLSVYSESNHSTAKYKDINFGIKTLSVEMEKDDRGRSFYFKVNNKKIFCKGGNWVPANAIYSNAENKRYEFLINQAKNANFNMLRIWGGANYERDIFYDLCDKNGILLWHDFMFACALYPDYNENFKTLVTAELDYQTKRLRNHVCIALFAGNNENHWVFDYWKQQFVCDYFYGGILYNEIMPEVVHKNCPHIFYWNSSPYGGENANNDEYGDKHHWVECLMGNDMQKRIDPAEFDKVTARFVSEYGYIGPQCKTTTQKYMGDSKQFRNGDIWNHHMNWFDKQGKETNNSTLEAGVKFQYGDIDLMNFDEYILYAGQCQGLLYGYTLESLRYNPDCDGGLFWMYDDMRGEAGWGIIDYLGLRKIPYYHVKRALEHVKLIIREAGNKIIIRAVNDTDKEEKVDLIFGYLPFKSKILNGKSVKFEIKPFTNKIVAEFKKADFSEENKENKENKGIFFAADKNNKINPAVLQRFPIKDLNLEKPAFTVKIKSKYEIEITSDLYCHCVYFETPDDINLTDNFFDLLPGRTKTVKVENPKGDFNFKNYKPEYLQRFGDK